MNTSSPQKDQSKKTVIAKVLKKSKELLKYSKKGGGSIQYFNVIVASGVDVHHLKIYQVHKFSMVRVGMSYKFKDCIQKGDNGLWVVSTSTIGFVRAVEVSEELGIQVLPEDEPPAGCKRTLQQALGTSARSTVHAKIVKVSPIKFTKQNTLPVRCLGLKDSSGYAKVALFQNLAEKTYVPNSIVELTGVYQKSDTSYPSQLAVTRDTTCQFLTEDILDVNINDEDEQHFLKDGDFSIRDADTITTYEIEAINEVMVYEACTTLGCRLKKLRDGSCPNCEGSDSRTTYMAKISFTGENNFSKELTMFQQNLERLFGSFPTGATEDEAIEFMLGKLPISFKGKFSGTNMYDITVVS